MTTRMLSIDDVCEQLGLSKSSVRRLISEGHLRAYRVGQGAIRIKPADVEKALRPLTISRSGC
jgi:excisionase family DNA binding protein